MLNKAETLLVAGINRAELQRKFLSEKDTFIPEPTGRLWNDRGPKRIAPGASSPTTSILYQTPPIPGQATWFKKEPENQEVQLVWRSTPPTGMQVSTNNLLQVPEKGAHSESLWKYRAEAILY